MLYSTATACSSSLFSSSKVNTVSLSPKRTRLNHSLLRLRGQSQTHELTLSPSPLQTPSFHVSDRLNHLSSEFHALPEPIERVKRLLHYAAMLPPLGDSDRVPENRVSGCSTQVWLVSEMDEEGRMRFRADSDSEISKGFCWCLVWMLDGAEPHEVLLVERDDLVGMNVGLNVKAHSRVNTWHNILFGMQKATKDLVLQKSPHRTHTS